MILAISNDNLQLAEKINSLSAVFQLEQFTFMGKKYLKYKFGFEIV